MNQEIKLNGVHVGSGLVFTFCPHPDDHLCKVQKSLFAECSRALMEHGLVFADVFESGQSRIGAAPISASEAEYLRQQFAVDPGQFKVILLGPDQHIHLITDSCVSGYELLMRVSTEKHYFEPLSL